MTEQNKKELLLSEDEVEIEEVDHSEGLCGFHCWAKGLNFGSVKALYQALEGKLDNPLLQKKAVDHIRAFGAHMNACNWKPRRMIPRKLWMTSDLGRSFTSFL